LLFLLFLNHIMKVTDPFVVHGLGKNIPFMIGVLCGGIIFGTVAGFVSMVPYMMKDVHQLSTAEIGSVINFPGTMSVIIFGYIGGILVDRTGPLSVLNIVVTFYCVRFLTSYYLLSTFLFFMSFC